MSRGMTKATARWTAALAAAGVALAGCAHEPRRSLAASPPTAAPTNDRAVAIAPTGPTGLIGVTNAQPPSIDPTILAQLASARCDREDSCGDVGDGRRYASHSTCLDQVRDGITSDLESYGCPRMGETAVRQCLVAMGRQDCGAPGEQALTHVEECAVSALCTPFGKE